MAERPTDLTEDPLADYDPDPQSVDPQSVQPAGESWDDAAPTLRSTSTRARPSRSRSPKASPATAAVPAPAAAQTHDPAAPPVVPVELNPIELSAETAILAAILVSPETFDDLNEKLVPDDFGVPAHQSIYAAVLACDASGRPFDPITVADEMRREGTLARSGGLDYLNSLVSARPELENLGAYVEITIDRSLRRRMVNASRIIGMTALDPTKDAQAGLDIAEHTVFELGQKRNDSGVAPMPLVVAQIHAEMAQARQAKLVGHSTGLEELDQLTGGLRGGQLIIIAARPGMGKSVLGAQIARHISEVSDLVVPLLTYEMTQSEVGFRLLSAATEIGLQGLLKGDVPPGYDRTLAREAEKMAQLRLLIDDQPPQNISGVRSAMRRLARRAPLGAIVIDYLQLMNGDGGRRDENRTQEVSAISRALKLLAKELDVPVIALSQLSRGLESRPNRRPLLSDLRESGSIEQDANLVAFLYRDFVYDKAASESDAELIIAKNRQGPQATILLDWDSKHVKFTQSDRKADSFGTAPAGPAAPAGGFGGGGRAALQLNNNPF